MTLPPRPVADDDERAALLHLLASCGHGDRRAFAHLYDRTSAKLFGVCVRILRERKDAEEVLQEVYLSVWERARSFDATRGTAMTWLITIARNRSIDRLRAGGRLPSTPIDDAAAIADTQPLASDMMEAADERRRLMACIAELPGQDAVLIRAAFLEGATYARLATRSATPLGTIKSRIRRALLKLRQCLQ